MDLLCIEVEKEMKEVNSKEFSVVKIIQLMRKVLHDSNYALM